MDYPLNNRLDPLDGATLDLIIPYLINTPF